MPKNGFKVLDSDMHILEPPDLWQRFIDSKFKDYAPRGTTDHVRDLRLVGPDGGRGAGRWTLLRKQFLRLVTSLSATKNFSSPIWNGAGALKSNSMPWMRRESILRCSIPAGD